MDLKLYRDTAKENKYLPLPHCACRQPVINIFLQEQDQRGDNRNDHAGGNHLPARLVGTDETEQRRGNDTLLGMYRNGM